MMNVETSRCRMSRSRIRCICLSRLKWKKHAETVLLMCCRISRRLSSITPRSRTTSTGLIVTWPTWMSRLAFSSRLRLAAEPNQISSVFSGFNCSRLDEHSLEIWITFDSMLWRQVSISKTGQQASSWVSSAYISERPVSWTFEFPQCTPQTP